MKILWLLVVVAAMLAGISGIAKADPVDYKIGGLDPLAGPGFAIVVPNQPFPLTFVNDCALFGLSDDGCFFGFNASSTTLTTLDIIVPNNSVLAGQPVDCVTTGLFSNESCTGPTDGSDTGEYILDFSGGTGIGAWDYFIIFEDGVPAADFPTGNAVVNATPEPSSIWLALSGTGALGYLVRRRRRILS
jgi:hypothetical protein